MGFWRRRQQKVNGLWYPQSVTMGTIETDKIIERLAQISTVSKSDVQAVLGDLATVMADYMSLGYTVKLDGLGTFYFTAVTNKQGVATKEEVNANQITGVRVRFLPEREKNSSGAYTRALVDTKKLEWIELGANAEDQDPAQGDGTDDGTGSDGSFG